MKREDYVIRYIEDGFFWKCGGTFTSALYDATMFGTKEAANTQLGLLGFERDEMCVAKVNKNGTRRVK